MKYKGIELKAITTSQIVDPPKEMLVWNGDMVKLNQEPHKEIVYAVVQLGICYVAITSSYQWDFCAEIPEEPKPRRATNMELAKWLAQGNGGKTEGGWVFHGHAYPSEKANIEVRDAVKVRKWDDCDWHEPTVDYMGIEDKQSDTKHVASYDVTDKYGNQYSVRWTENGLKVFPTPISIEKVEEIILLARLNRACTDKNCFKEDEVEVGNQIWMAKNLDITDGGEGIYFNHDTGEYYYTWDAAKRIADKIPGWHLPSRDEWDELFTVVNYPPPKGGELLVVAS